MSTRLSPQKCVACGNTIDAASQLAKRGEAPATPKPGDITLCIRCGCIMVWSTDMKFRLPTKRELRHLSKDKRISSLLVTAVEAIEAVNKRRAT